MNIRKTMLILMPVIMLTGCVTTNKNVFENSEQQLKMRSIQTKSFDTSDKNVVIRDVIATLQDVEFVIESADYDLGTVSATKFDTGYIIKATVTIKSKGEKQTVVRVNARQGNKVIEDPIPYQNFFSALSKSLFLSANNID